MKPFALFPQLNNLNKYVSLINTKPVCILSLLIPAIQVKPYLFSRFASVCCKLRWPHIVQGVGRTFMKTPTIVSIAPTSDTSPPHPALPNNQYQPPRLVPPKVRGDSEKSENIKHWRKVSTQPARKVGDLAKMFEKTQDVKTTPPPGRRPAPKEKTTKKTTRTEKEHGGTRQGVPEKVEQSVENSCENLT